MSKNLTVQCVVPKISLSTLRTVIGNSKEEGVDLKSQTFMKQN